ncbi:MAG: hypothetical protein PHR77_08980 [Kiritimatiellae bacterium]|nr:hypothetical protein [Kiritimatiellia bacterium]MDD5522875.1 hypothetical protein [Kiritimatiellia bacterium]
MRELCIRYLSGLLLFITIFTGNPACTILATDLRVNKNSVNLRSAPSETAEIVAQLSEGDILITEKNVDGEWIEVIPPANVSFWVYGELLKDGIVAASKVKVRVGPGINYRSVGEIAKDEKVSVRGEYREWLKIASPLSCRLWINRKSVDPVDKAVSDENKNVLAGKFPVPEKPAISGDKTTVFPSPVAVPPVPRVLNSGVGTVPNVKSSISTHDKQISAERRGPSRPELAIRNNLVSSREQGRMVQYAGVLRRSGFFVWRQPSKYRLVTHDHNGVAATVCHVMGDERQLALMQDKSVVVNGKEYWVQGLRQSVVLSERIIAQN